MDSIRQYLEKQPLIFDGAMGTLYAEKSRQKCEFANINDRDTVLSIHRRYIEAGARAIKTNTFGANPDTLGVDRETAERIIAEGVRIAREAAAAGPGPAASGEAASAAEAPEEAFVFADIGPLPGVPEPDHLQKYIDTIRIFLREGVSNFLFETFASAEFLPGAAAYIRRECPEAYIIVSFAVDPDGFTRLGLSGKSLFRSLASCPDIDAVGFNCISGASHLKKFVRELDFGGRTVSVMPNSGYPTISDNRTFYNYRPDYFAEQMLEIRKSGVRILGGCCGTTPEYIEKTVRLIRSAAAGDIPLRAPEKPLPRPVDADRNSFTRKLLEGEKVIAVELDPPPADDGLEVYMEGVRVLRGAGADAVTIADCPVARARMDSSLLACKIRRELGATPIPHMTCRDRNLNATKALLLGLSAEGVSNILVVTGDPVPSAERDEIKTLFSYNSAVLAGHISTLNETVLKRPFQISAALNVNAVNFDAQLRQAERKIESGVTAFMTQPVLSDAAAENLAKAHAVLPAKILGGIMPIVSYRNACFMNSEVPGIRVSDAIIEMYRDLDREQAAGLAVRISVDTARRIRDICDGFYIITPFRRVDIVAEIISRIKLL